MRNLDREPDQEPGEGWKRGFRFHDIGTETLQNEDGEIVGASFTITEGGVGGKPRVVTMTQLKNGKRALDQVLGEVVEHDALQEDFNAERVKDDADVWELQTLRKALTGSHAGLLDDLQPKE